MNDISALKPYLIKISYFYEDYIPRQVEQFGAIDTFYNYFNSTDCTRWDKDHIFRLTQTISHIYKSDLSCCYYILENYFKPKDEEDDEELYNELVQKLINRHLDNLEYEKTNPCVKYKDKLNRKLDSNNNVITKRNKESKAVSKKISITIKAVK